MPGFRINNVGGNGSAVNHESRFYSTFTWEIPSLFVKTFENNNKTYSVTTGYDTGIQDILLKTAQLPAINYEQIKAKGGSIEYKFAGKPTFEPIKISFYDTYKLSNLLVQWSNSIWNETRGLKAANRYKKQTTISKYLIDRDLTTSDQFKQKPDGTVKYNLYGSWPMVIRESELTYVESGIKTVELTIMYDHFSVEISGSKE